MPRQARLDAPGTLHHVIVRGIEKRRIFEDDDDRNAFVSRMGDLASEGKTSIYAWSLMPNHVHILLRSGVQGLPKFMRRLLTGYAVTYNRRHQRHGHLFQNRYKSILCEEDTYFTELVRYIHLNPLRAKLVEDLSSLERDLWCGHGVLIGRFKNEWQDRDYVLSWFGKKEGAARMAYRKHVEEGVVQGRRPELVGGGLVRSQGGWSQVLSMRRRNLREASDERILGSGDFVERVIQEAEEQFQRMMPARKRKQEMTGLINKMCEKEGISRKELQSGGRRGPLSMVRARLALEMVRDRGFSLAETARQLGVSTSGIYKLLLRRKA
jgi:REP element-mobilizing transposase RayT